MQNCVAEQHSVGQYGSSSSSEAMVVVGVRRRVNVAMRERKSGSNVNALLVTRACWPAGQQFIGSTTPQIFRRKN